MNTMPESDSEDELPPGWEEKATDDGYVFFVNHQNKISQWTHPRTKKIKKVAGELPIDWIKTEDPETKKTIFYNEKTNQSTFVDPRLAFAAEEPTLDIAKVRQRFDASSTAMLVLYGKDLYGKVAIITGANSGIGFETARSLVLHGCEVIFACRNRKATEEAIESIAKERSSAGARCRFVELDLASFKSVFQFVDEIKKSVRHVDYLILNAGVFALPYTKTIDGLETTFQISHLSHFYITLQLEPLLDPTSRVIVVSSESHRFSNLPTDNLTAQRLSPPKEKYWSMMAYNNAKLCNILFASELATRWSRKGISVFSLHPGNMVSTNLSKNWWFYRLLFALVRPFTKSLQQAAATTVFCATASELTGLSGQYFNNCFFCVPSSLSQNDNLKKELWDLSEKMIATIKEQLQYD